jgi:hypothetical protein
VNVNREGKPGSFTSSLDHASNTHPAEWLAALIEEDVVRLDALLRIGPPQLAQRLMFVPLQVMAAIGAALQPADDNVRFVKSAARPPWLASNHQPQCSA